MDSSRRHGQSAFGHSRRIISAVPPPSSTPAPSTSRGPSAPSDAASSAGSRSTHAPSSRPSRPSRTSQGTSAYSHDLKEGYSGHVPNNPRNFQKYGKTFGTARDQAERMSQWRVTGINHEPWKPTATTPIREVKTPGSDKFREMKADQSTKAMRTNISLEDPCMRDVMQHKFGPPPRRPQHMSSIMKRSFQHPEVQAQRWGRG